MQTHIYSVYDNKGLVYSTPFFAINDGHAVRSFSDLANDVNTTVGRHPGDFSLFCLGTFDDVRPNLVGVVPIRHVIDALNVLRRQEQLFSDVEGNFNLQTATSNTRGAKRGDELANGEDR